MSLWKVVRPLVWAAFRLVSRLNLMLRGHEYRYIFILGHMRSGSTLLAHILASHPDIVGAGETHTSYRTPADLPKLVLKTCELLHRPILRARYIVDQINHPHVTTDVLLSERVNKCIILVRKPEATLKSLMKLLNCKEGEALEAYTKRLESLTQYGLVLKKRALLVEYDDLVDHSKETLAALTSFLELDSPLTPIYSTHRMTGRVEGFGDPSHNIKIGRIVRTPHHEITIGNDILLAARRAYYECRAQLQAVTVQAMSRAVLPDESSSIPVLNE
jgi:Sulfotransferase family